MKNKSYRFLSIILSILVLVGACVCPAVATAETTNVSRTTNVLHFEANNKGPLGQRATLTEGETYVFSFSLSNGLGFTVDLFDKNTRNKAKGATATQISATDKGKYTEYVYEILVPDIFTETSDQAFVGIQFDNKTTDGYFFNASLYLKSDANKTEMFLNGDFSLGNLNNWCWRWNKTAAGGDQTSGTFSHSDGDVFLEVVSFKETTMYETTRVLHFEANNVGPLAQRATLTEGETYVFSFSLSSELGFKVDLFDNSTRNKAKGATATEISATEKSGYTEYVYEILVPDIFTDATSGMVFVGIQLNDKKTDGYFFDASLYKKSDTSKTEMFLNGDFSLGNLNNWCWRWNKTSAGGDQTSGTFSHSDGDVFLEVVDIKDTVLYDTTRVLYVKSSKTAPIGQLVDLTAGETYVFSFAISNGLTVNAIRLHDRSNRYQNLSGYTVGTPVTDTTTSDLYTTYTYEVTLNATEFTKTSALFGVMLNGTSAGGYLFNVSLYKKSDTNKTELFVNNDFSNINLDGWSYKYMTFGSAEKGLAGLKSATFSVEGTALNEAGETYIEVMNVEDTEIYDESFMPATTPNKMVEINSNHKGPFGTQINTTAGETYTFKFGISDDLDFNVVLYDKDARYSNLNATATLKSSDDSADGYTYYEYEVVVPSTYTKDGAILGITFNGTAPYKGYFFDASAYKTSDTGKTELIANGDFADGYLNNWVWKYTNFGANGNLTEKTFQEDSKDVTVKVVDFDASLMAPDTTPKMVHIESNNAGPIGQLITAKAGETYTLTFAISNNAKFDVVANDGSSRHTALDAKAEFIKGEDKGRYAIWTYEVTMPQNLTENNNNVLLGIKLKGTSPYDCYLTNVSAYKTSDTEKTELFTNGDFMSGYLDNWRFKYTNFAGDNLGKTTHTFTEDSKSVTLTVMAFDETKMTEVAASFPDPAPKMLHIESNNAGPIGQLINAKAGETYTLTFAISNNAKFDVVAYNGSSRHVDLGATAEFISAEDKGRYAIWIYEVTMPDNLTEGNNNALLGLKLKGTAPYDCYLMDVSAYKTDDTAKTELFKNGDFLSGYLDNWRFKYTNFSGEGKVGLSTSTFTEDSKSVTLTVEKFDQSKMQEVAAEFPNTDPQMLYINGSSVGPLGQQVTVAGGETYTITFDISNNLKFDVAVHDREARHSAISDVEVTYVNGVDNGRYTTYTYNIKMPEEIISAKTGEKTDLVVIGIKLKGASSYEGYFANALLYKTSDTAKTNMYTNGDFFSSYLDGWYYRYQNFTGSNLGFKSKSFTSDGDMYLEVMDFDESKMEDVAADLPPTCPQMLHIEGDHVGPIGQLLAAKAGETYTFTFSLSNNANFDVVVNDGSKRHASVGGTTIKYVNGDDKGRYTVYTYEVTMPEDLSATNVLLGIKLKGSSPYDCYLMDASVYNAADTTKKDLFKNGDFAGGELDSWRWKYINISAGLSSYTNDNYEDGDVIYTLSLEVMDFDESKMQDVAAVLPDYSRKMIYFKNGAITQSFSAWVNSAPGKSFIVSYSIYATDEVVPRLNANGLRGKIGAAAELISETKMGLVTNYTYKVTVPDTYEDDLVFLGFNMPFYVEGYIFDIVCYEEGDATKSPVWTNADFAWGFDEWIWGWTVTWFSKTGTHLRTWSDATHEITLVPYDLSLITALDSDIKRDDGQWWKASDIIEAEEEDLGSATVKGTFTDQNGTALGNVKLILKSADNTYTTYTDANGNFIFKGIIPSYYELFYIGSDGNEVLTDFAYFVDDGDTVTLKLVSDTSELGKVATSTLSGTVYTPDLKTVAGLKVYLRGFGEVTTDADGNFTFTEVPVGEYELYTILEDGSEYVFRTVEIKENVDLAVKLKYDPATATESDGIATWIWIVSGCTAVVILALLLILFIILKKRKSDKEEKQSV